MLSIQLNGQKREFPDSLTVSALLDVLDLKQEGIAVAVNQRVVPRTEHAQVEIPNLADVEVIRAVGGG